MKDEVRVILTKPYLDCLIYLLKQSLGKIKSPKSMLILISIDLDTCIGGFDTLPR